MKQLKHIFFIAIFTPFLFSGAFSQTQPVITNVTYPTSVEKYDMIEISFNIDFSGDPTQLNYYDPDEVDVYCVFTNTETGTTEQINAFHYVGYIRSSTINPDANPPWYLIETLSENSNENGWKVRFTPEIETYENDDNWTFSITAINHNAGTTATTGDYSFKCTPSDRKGFIGVSQSNNRYFEYSNGGNYIPVGQNVGWYLWKGAVKDNESLGDMEELKAYKFNHFAKIDIRNDVMDIIINSYEEIEEDTDIWAWKDDFDTFTLPVSLKICGGEIETWDEDITYVDEIRVCEGSTLTIKSEVSMVENGLITVECGGILYIDGGKITSVNSEKWQGIKVLGYSPSTNINDQGLLLMNNGAIVENSTKGIFTGLNCNGGGPGGYFKCFGAVRAQDASFKNNDASASLENSQIPNYSFFRNCSFVVDESSVPPGQEEPFVSLIDMDGVDFTSCIFSNQVAGYNSRGIYSANTSFSIDGDCDPFACSSLFEGFGYGVYATAVSSNNFMNIAHTHFNKNLKGVYVSGMDNLSLTECNFTTSSTNSSGYGLYLDACTGYTIEDNSFVQGVQDGIGLIVNNSGGDPNRIYRNSFTGLKFGILAQQENRAADGNGLVLKCNTYNENGHDQLVLWDGLFMSKNAGIAEGQGTDIALANAPAGNRFSQIGPDGSATDIYNEANTITYYYHVAEPFWHLQPKYFTDETVSIVPVDEAQWLPDESCPPSDGGGGGIGDTEGMKNTMATSEQKADSIQNIINILKDGGSTGDMKAEVEFSAPPQAYAVYNELMNSSPYISDTVMAAAIEKEDVLPNVMIRDVMVANPHNAKNDALMEKIEGRTNPMPDYMKAQILQGGSLVSLFENLQSNLAFYEQQRKIAFNALVEHYITDTIDPAGSIDSLTVLLQNENSRFLHHQVQQ